MADRFVSFFRMTRSSSNDLPDIIKDNPILKTLLKSGIQKALRRCYRKSCVRSASFLDRSIT
jgi:hypothetical protein